MQSIFVVSPVRAQSFPSGLLHPSGILISSDVFTPVIINGITFHSDQPFQFDFLMDEGDAPVEDHVFQQEAQRLIHYFFAALTTPENQMWVNLSPYEKDRIIADHLSSTELGRDLLAQDYLLKQLSASLMYPENEFGKAFWQRVYQKAHALYGTTDIPLNTFNKIWIIPERARVYAHQNTIIISDSRLKVLLEEDYLALEHHSALDAATSGESQQAITGMTAEVVREVLLPEIEREVNTGKHFAPLRQMYHALILAAWYKKNLKESFLSKVYVDQNRVEGIDVVDKAGKNRIYQKYLEALKQGVFNYIKEEKDLFTEEVIPRKYFSGGVDMAALSEEISDEEPIAGFVPATRFSRPHRIVSSTTQVRETPGNKGLFSDRAMTAFEQNPQVLQFMLADTFLSSWQEFIDMVLSIAEGNQDVETQLFSIATRIGQQKFPHDDVTRLRVKILILEALREEVITPAKAELRLSLLESDLLAFQIKVRTAERFEEDIESFMDARRIRMDSLQANIEALRIPTPKVYANERIRHVALVELLYFLRHSLISPHQFDDGISVTDYMKYRKEHPEDVGVIANQNTVISIFKVLEEMGFIEEYGATQRRRPQYRVVPWAKHFIETRALFLRALMYEANLETHLNRHVKKVLDNSYLLRMVKEKVNTLADTGESAAGAEAEVRIRAYLESRKQKSGVEDVSFRRGLGAEPFGTVPETEPEKELGGSEGLTSEGAGSFNDEIDLDGRENPVDVFTIPVQLNGKGRPVNRALTELYFFMRYHFTHSHEFLNGRTSFINYKQKRIYEKDALAAIDDARLNRFFRAFKDAGVIDFIFEEGKTKKRLVELHPSFIRAVRSHPVRVRQILRSVTNMEELLARNLTQVEKPGNINALKKAFKQVLSVIHEESLGQGSKGENGGSLTRDVVEEVPAGVTRKKPGHTENTRQMPDNEIRQHILNQTFPDKFEDEAVQNYYLTQLRELVNRLGGIGLVGFSPENKSEVRMYLLSAIASFVPGARELALRGIEILDDVTVDQPNSVLSAEMVELEAMLREVIDEARQRDNPNIDSQPPESNLPGTPVSVSATADNQSRDALVEMSDRPSLALLTREEIMAQVIGRHIDEDLDRTSQDFRDLVTLTEALERTLRWGYVDTDLMEGVRPFLIQVTKNRNPVIRENGIKSLAQFNGDEPIMAIINHLPEGDNRDRNRYVRKSEAESLASILFHGGVSSEVMNTLREYLMGEHGLLWDNDDKTAGTSFRIIKMLLKHPGQKEQMQEKLNRLENDKISRVTQEKINAIKNELDSNASEESVIAEEFQIEDLPLTPEEIQENIIGKEIPVDLEKGSSEFQAAQSLLRRLKRYFQDHADIFQGDESKQAVFLQYLMSAVKNQRYAIRAAAYRMLNYFNADLALDIALEQAMEEAKEKDGVKLSVGQVKIFREKIIQDQVPLDLKNRVMSFFLRQENAFLNTEFLPVQMNALDILRRLALDPEVSIEGKQRLLARVEAVDIEEANHLVNQLRTRIVEDIQEAIAQAGDPAMAEASPLGGIDFDANHLDLQKSGDNAVFDSFSFDAEHFDPAQIQSIVPVIINITPISTLLPAMGLTISSEDEKDAAPGNISRMKPVNERRDCSA